MSSKLSIVIPAYNEEKRIVSSLKKIHDYCKKNKLDYEVIVSDDGSNDKTVEVVKEYSKIVRSKKNRGKGSAVRKGVLSASGDLILVSDADLSTPISDFKKLEKYLGKYDVVIGSRDLKTSNIILKQPLYRKALGRIFNVIVSSLLISGIKDTQCGFKLFTKDVAKKIFSKTIIDGFAYDIEALFLAKKNAYKIKEVGVVWENDVHSKVNPLKDSVKMLFEIFKIKFNDLRGRYE